MLGAKGPDARYSQPDNSPAARVARDPDAGGNGRQGAADRATQRDGGEPGCVATVAQHKGHDELLAAHGAYHALYEAQFAAAQS